ncbi:MAG: hypothetical protein R3C56_27425 [Pirellulaceae bacterium]
MATGDLPGGGPIESLIRMPLQTGAMVDLDLGNEVLETVIKGADQGVMYTLVSVFQAIRGLGSSTRLTLWPMALTSPAVWLRDT